VDSRRNTPVDDFGIEKHTLVTREVTQIFHRSSTVVLQVTAGRAHSFRVRVQFLRRFSGSTCPFQGEFRDSSPTHLRGRQGAYFFWFLVRFRQRNHLWRTFRTLGVRHLGRTHSGYLSNHQFRFGEILSIHFTVDLGDQFETHINRFRRWNH
jgi:hypothetical protein